MLYPDLVKKEPFNIEERLTFSVRGYAMAKSEAEYIQRAQRLVEIVNESVQIANKTKSRATRLSRLDVAIKSLIEVKQISSRFDSVHMDNMGLLDYQLTKWKYELIREDYE